jgi:hypothetical protein
VVVVAAVVPITTVPEDVVAVVVVVSSVLLVAVVPNSSFNHIDCWVYISPVVPKMPSLLKTWFLDRVCITKNVSQLK